MDSVCEIMRESRLPSKKFGFIPNYHAFDKPKNKKRNMEHFEEDFYVQMLFISNSFVDL